MLIRVLGLIMFLVVVHFDSVFPIDVFTFSENNVIVGNINEVFFNYSACSISLWHKRLAHTNVKNIEKNAK